MIYLRKFGNFVGLFSVIFQCLLWPLLLYFFVISFENFNLTFHNFKHRKIL
jgi:hypothetical protein